MLVKFLKRTFKESKSQKIHEIPGINSVSGISATVFGATGFIGNSIGPNLGSIGSDLIFPSKERFWFSDNVKMLRLSGAVGYVFINHNTNFQDPKTLKRLVEKSNVVINCIGPRKKYTRLEQFKEANIDLPRKIAREARLAGVKRFIHLSNVAVDPRSPSMDLATKAEGELWVREEFPEATILRLCTVMGQNDYFQRIFRIQSGWFDKFVPVFSDLTAKRQPIMVSDVANCVLSALKMPETAGQIFELGGPHVYTLKEIHDVMVNVLRRPTYYVKMNKDLMLAISKYISYEQFNRDDIIKQDIDMVVTGRPGLKGIQDLFYKPVSVIPAIEFEVGHYREVPDIVRNDYQL